MHGAALQLLCSVAVVANSVFLPSCGLEDCLVSRRFCLLVPFGSRLINVTHFQKKKHMFVLALWVVMSPVKAWNVSIVTSKCFSFADLEICFALSQKNTIFTQVMIMLKSHNIPQNPPSQADRIPGSETVHGPSNSVAGPEDPEVPFEPCF
jgi:hypothetical protein